MPALHFIQTISTFFTPSNRTKHKKKHSRRFFPSVRSEFTTTSTAKRYIGRLVTLFVCACVCIAPGWCTILVSTKRKIKMFPFQWLVLVIALTHSALRWRWKTPSSHLCPRARTQWINCSGSQHTALIIIFISVCLFVSCSHFVSFHLTLSRSWAARAAGWWLVAKRIKVPTATRRCDFPFLFFTAAPVLLFVSMRCLSRAKERERERNEIYTIDIRRENWKVPLLPLRIRWTRAMKKKKYNTNGMRA